MTAADRAAIAQYNRIRRLPGQIDRARRRVAQLETEARRLGMRDLLDG